MSNKARTPRKKAMSRIEELQTMEYPEYLKTPEWQQRRHAALDFADNRCQVCNSDKAPDVHHRAYERIGCELPRDLVVLCRSCHELFHLEKKSGEESVRFPAYYSHDTMPNEYGFVSSTTNESDEEMSEAWRWFFVGLSYGVFRKADVSILRDWNGLDEVLFGKAMVQESFIDDAWDGFEYVAMALEIAENDDEARNA